MTQRPIPSIAVHTDSSTPELHIDDYDDRMSSPDSPPPTQGHTRTPSDPTLLSPILRSRGVPGPGRTSLDVPPRHHSPSPSDASSADASYVPPSPTLSTRSSVHFATSLDLRGNKPESSTGMTSLQLLGPEPSSAHRRRGSGATLATISAEEEGAGGQYGLAPLSRAQTGQSGDASMLESPTQTHVEMMSDRSVSPAPTGHRRSTSRASGKQAMTEDSHTLNHEAGVRPPGEDDKDGEQQQRPVLDLTQDEGIDPAPFEQKPNFLASLVDPKSLESLESIGGVEGLLRGLGTSATKGLPHKGGSSPKPKSDPADDDAVPGIVVTSPDGDAGSGVGGSASAASMDDRRRVYGHNAIPARASKSLLSLMWTALKDKVLIILSIAAVVSLALGLFQDFGTPRTSDDPPVDWVEGVAIMVAIAIVVMVGSLNDWQKERQFKVLNEKKEERTVRLIRGGQESMVDVKDVVVGDIAVLEPGEIIPVDGVFLSGHNVKCDESGATGESDAIKKLPYDECIAIRDRMAQRKANSGDHGDDLAHTDCFVLSGSKILEGYGQYVVIAVGPKSFNGRILMGLQGPPETTPLQLKLNALAELIAKLGSAAGLLLFSALMIRFFVQLGTGTPERTSSQKGLAFVQILIISVTLVVVAVPEGLPLAVTLALAFATKRMTKEKLLVRILGACETMANASVICTDKTGTLTQNEMTVVAGSVGIHGKFVRRLEDNQTRTNANEETEQSDRRHAEDFSIDQTDLNRVLPSQLRLLVNDAICVNSTAFEDEDPETGERVFVGSKTETALLKFAKELGWADYRKTRESADVVQMIPFSSDRKAMGVVVKNGPGRWRLYMKGASEILTRRCTEHVVVKEDGSSGSSDEVATAEIGTLERDNIQRTIIFYANQTLRTIALCYRDYTSWPPHGASFTSEDEVEYEDLARDMTLIGITGIEDPLRPGVRDAVAACHKAGVSVKMCTGDNVLTARSIAIQCGIYTPGGIIMEGPVFRQLDDHDMLQVVPRLQVLARSSPEDKKILVGKLRELGEIVGVTGDGTNDGPALKTADVGFSMGIAGTEVAKEASDVILMDDNFASIVKAIMWGRCVNDAVRKFLQFQISTNITAVIITFVSAVASDQEESVLSAVQLLWINIIMDTFAALALATDPATESLLDRLPDKKTAPLFSVDMYKQILGQSAYQAVITLVFHFLGFQILGMKHSDVTKTENHNNAVLQTLVFNIFVFAQVFNSINSRRLDNRLNIFEGIWRNWYFICITLIEVVVQIIIVFVGGAAFQVTHIGGREWGISLALGFVSIPLGALIRCIPNGPTERLFQKVRLLPRPDVLPTQTEESEWNAAIQLVRDNLNTFANVRGGRLRSSSFAMKSRKSGPEPEQRPAISSLLTMVPTLVATSVGAGWAPQEGSLSDPAHSDPSKSTAALWEDKVQVHPDTKADDYAFRRWGHRGGEV